MNNAVSKPDAGAFLRFYKGIDTVFIRLNVVEGDAIDNPIETLEFFKREDQRDEIGLDENERRMKGILNRYSDHMMGLKIEWICGLGADVYVTITV